MAARDASLYDEIILESNNGTKSVDLRPGVVGINYYEDIFSPTLTAQISVINTGGTILSDDGKYQSLYSGLPLRGGERVSIKIAGNSENNKGLDFSTPEKYFYVTKIGPVIRDGQKEIINLNLVSREAISNETSRVYEKFKKAPITDHVSKIIKDYLRSDKPLNSDPVRDTYSFIGNLKKPFTLLVWLAARSVPAVSGGLAGYFFYETQDGFNFRSVDQLIVDGKNSAAAEYFHKEYQDYQEDTDDRILSYTINKNHDLLEKLRLGTYASFFAQYDPLFGRFTLPQEGKFTLDDYTTKTINLGDDPEVPKLLNESGMSIADMPSRIVTSILDVGTMEQGVSLAPNIDAFKYQRESLLRYNLMFMQVLNMTVPLNTNLKAGDVIRCNFIKISSNSDDFDREQSGLYMIKELCHHFDSTQSLTSMKLIRDTYGEFGN